MRETGERFVVEMSQVDLAQWRKAHYNATVIALRLVHEDLLVMRVRPDQWPLPFEAAQYFTLGLGAWEQATPAAGSERESPRAEMVRRAYSLSCSVFDETGALRRPRDFDYLEFYVTQVHAHRAGRPSLSPRLFALTVGDRLHVGRRAHGEYTLKNVTLDDDVLLLGTGVGEAPHNTLAAELLARGQRGRVVCATCVRQRRDLAYLEVHRELERRFANYRYVALTTREPENVDAARPDYVGKQYLQSWVRSGGLERALGGSLAPERAHAFLCGNGDMIGAPPRHGAGHAAPGGMIVTLTQLGFRLDEPRRPGNVHYERFF